MAIETGDRRVIHVGPYQGGTLGAQITTLLHELVHVVDAIPEDDSSRFANGRPRSRTSRTSHRLFAFRWCRSSLDR